MDAPHGSATPDIYIILIRRKNMEMGAIAPDVPPRPLQAAGRRSIKVIGCSD